MLEVFLNHEKRTSEEAGTSERTHQLPYRSPSLLSLPGRHATTSLQMRPPNSKMHLASHHPSTLPMQLPSNVMVVPPQQIATSSSHQSFINTVHKRKAFPLAVAHPIIRQNPNFKPSMAHAAPLALPQKLKVVNHAINSPKSAEDSPLDLSAPLDLSVKRKNDAEKEDTYQLTAAKRQRLLADTSDGRPDRSASPSRKCSAILSKPPPIYPGLHRASAEHLIRQQRKVHPLIHEGLPNDPSLMHHKYLHHHHKVVNRNQDNEEAKLWLARQEFAMQSPKMLQKSGPPPTHPHLPVKRVQAAVPPLVTSTSGGPRVLTHREQVQALIIPQQISEHTRLIEEKKQQLLARAAAMGIPIDKEPSRMQPSPRSSQLIKENGAVDSEMEEALRQMMQRSSHHPSSSPLLNGKPKPPHVTLTQNPSEMRRKLIQKAAYIDYMKKQMIYRNYQRATHGHSLASLSTPSSSTHSPPMPMGSRSTTHQEKQEFLKRRYFYDRHNSIPASHLINGLSQSMRNSPSTLASRECDRKMKLVQGVGTNSGPQYKYSLKDFEHRQLTAASHERTKTAADLRGMDLKSYHLLQRGHDSKDGRVHMYQELYKCRKEICRQDQVVPTQNGTGALGCTASRGPASQGLPHPISRLTSTSPVTPTITAPIKSHPHPNHSDPKLHPQQDKFGAMQSHFRNRKNLINPDVARDHILASMNPALRDLFQEKDQDKQLHLFQTLRKNHNSQLQRTKCFAINFRDVIAHEISKCIDESSDSSEVIDLTSEPSEGSGENTIPDVSGRVGSPQTNIPAAPVSIESIKQNIEVDSPPPLIKATDIKTGFVPLDSNSVIMSGAIAYSKCLSISEKCKPPCDSQGLVTSKMVEPSACIVDCKVSEATVKTDHSDNINVKLEVDLEKAEVKDEQNMTQEVTRNIEETASVKVDDNSAESSCYDFSDNADEELTTELNLSLPGSVKSVSYDPRRKVLAALNERLKSSPVDTMPENLTKTEDIDPPVEKYMDTKIIPRADQADKECQLPDQLFEDDEEEEEIVDDKRSGKDEPNSACTTGEEHRISIFDEFLPEPQDDKELAKPRRKRKRRVRRYYQIIPKRASSRKGRQAAMASSYHRDDRYEQEIEKERQKVMERKRRRTAVLRNQGLQVEVGQPCQDVRLAKANDSSEEMGESPRRQGCKAASTPSGTASFPSGTATTDGDADHRAGSIVEDGSSLNEDYERLLMAPNIELKVRIQRKDLTGRFHQNDNCQVVTDVKKTATKEGKGWQSLMRRKRLEAGSNWFFKHNRPSTSGLFPMQLNGRFKRRRRDTDVRRRLLEARILLDSRPAVPPPPKELKRLAVNKKLGETLLHKAARLGHDDSALYCINYCMQDINAKDNAGYTPLHECSVNGRLRVAKHMIAKGADVNGSAADGTRPVHDAIDNEKVEVGRLLLAHGGDPLIATYSGRTTRKLARSKETKTLVHGYLKDINGRFLAPAEELDGLKKINLNIRFHSSVQTSDDLVKCGIDFMAGAPEATPEDDEDEFMFELCDKPMLPSIALYLEEPKKFSNWLLLSDIIQRLEMTRPDFLYNHRDITVFSVTREDIERAPVGPDPVRNILERNLGKTVELVELDDHIREILGSEFESVK